MSEFKGLINALDSLSGALFLFFVYFWFWIFESFGDNYIFSHYLVITLQLVFICFTLKMPDVRAVIAVLAAAKGRLFRDCPKRRPTTHPIRKAAFTVHIASGR
jgi:hypothetical protein